MLIVHRPAFMFLGRWELVTWSNPETLHKILYELILMWSASSTHLAMAMPLLTWFDNMLMGRCCAESMLCVVGHKAVPLLFPDFSHDLVMELSRGEVLSL